MTTRAAVIILAVLPFVPIQAKESRTQALPPPAGQCAPPEVVVSVLGFSDAEAG